MLVESVHHCLYKMRICGRRKTPSLLTNSLVRNLGIVFDVLKIQKHFHSMRNSFSHDSNPIDGALNICRCCHYLSCYPRIVQNPGRNYFIVILHCFCFPLLEFGCTEERERTKKYPRFPQDSFCFLVLFSRLQITIRIEFVIVDSCSECIDDLPAFCLFPMRNTHCSFSAAVFPCWRRFLMKSQDMSTIRSKLAGASGVL